MDILSLIPQFGGLIWTIAAFILAYGVISGRIRKTVITLPMVFVAIGFLLGNQVLGLIYLDVEGRFVDIWPK